VKQGQDLNRRELGAQSLALQSMIIITGISIHQLCRAKNEWDKTKYNEENYL